MRTVSYLPKYWSVWVLTLILLTMSMGALAQEIPDPTIPTPTDLRFENLPEDIRAITQEMLERTVFHIRVAYLYGDGAIADDDLLAPHTFQALTGAILITSQDQLLAEWEKEPFDGIFVHASALVWLDTAWTQAAYRDEVITFGFNLQHSQMLDITGDECNYRENRRYLYPEDSYFVVNYSYAIEVNADSKVDEIELAILETCKDPIGLGYVRMHYGVFQYEFTTREELAWIISVMSGESVNFQKPRRYDLISTPTANKP